MARWHGRAFLGIELKREYAEMAAQRLGWEAARIELRPADPSDPPERKAST